MKTFEDLVFKDHPGLRERQKIIERSPDLDRTLCNCGFEKHAFLFFGNGYGISVITGPDAETDGHHPYEVAIMKGKTVCYDTPLTADVIGYCKEEDVTRLIKEISELPEEENDHGA